MLDTTEKLQISREDFDVIEAALHTQSHILNVQAEAGGKEARERLNAVKRILASIAQQRPVQHKRSAQKPCRPGLFWRWLGLSQTGC